MAVITSPYLSLFLPMPLLYPPRYEYRQLLTLKMEAFSNIRFLLRKDVAVLKSPKDCGNRFLQLHKGDIPPDTRPRPITET